MQHIIPKVIREIFCENWTLGLIGLLIFRRILWPQLLFLFYRFPAKPQENLQLDEKTRELLRLAMNKPGFSVLFSLKDIL